MSWRVAKCLDQLLAQINDAAPTRSKASDGAIGDAAHASTKSDHNPWVKDAKGIGVVTARDITHDPAHGCDCHALTKSLVASRDPRVKYIIWNRQIVTSMTWQWRPYTGKNPHTHHAHVSVKSTPEFYDSVQPWAMKLLAADSRIPPVAKRNPTLRRGDTGQPVKQLQTLLSVESDGIFGEETEAAVKQYQRDHGLVDDGVVGAYTWDALLGR